MAFVELDTTRAVDIVAGTENVVLMGSPVGDTDRVGEIRCGDFENWGDADEWECDRTR